MAYSYYYYETMNSVELEDFNDIMMDFYKDPDFDDFTTIWSNRRRLITTKGRVIKFWIWGVYQAQPHFFKNNQVTELNTWIREIERGLRRVQSNATVELLDNIWMLYFATGDAQYPEIVRKIASESPKYEIRESARFTYRDVMGVEWMDDQLDNQLDVHPDNQLDGHPDVQPVDQPVAHREVI